MATDVERLIVALEARTTAFEKAMNKANGVANQRARAIEQRFTKMNANINRSFQTALRGASMLGAGLGIREIQQMADAWTDMSARVGLAVGNMELAPQVMERIYDMAQRTYSGLGQTAEAFLGNATALRELGYSTNQQLDFTEALNNALVVSGAKAERAASVNNALSKAMADGKLSGDNLNTVIQTGGRVAEILAEKLGVSTNQLRQLGKDGKITSQVIYQALAGSLEKLRAEADAMPATISDGFQKIGNALTKFVGTMDRAAGVSGAIAQGLVFVADNFESVAIGAAAASAVLISKYAPALLRVAASQAAVVATNPFLLLASAIGAAAFALSAFGGEIQPVAGEMATLHDYAGAVWDVISDGASVAAGVISDAMLGAINLMVSAMDGVEVSWSDVLDFIRNAGNKIIGIYVAIYETAVTTYTKLPAAVADGVISAMNTMIGYVEDGINKVVSAVNTAIKAINSLGEWAGMGGIGMIDSVELGRVANDYAGAGEAAGKAYVDGVKKAFSQDYLGDGFNELRRRANERAARKAATGDGSGSALDTRGPNLGGAGGGGGAGGKGGRGRGGRPDELAREIDKIKERTAALQAETAAQAQINPLIDDYDYAMTKARATQDLLNAAQKAGIAITPELRAKIEQLAEGYAQATVEANKLQEAQENARQAAEDMRALGKDVLGGFIKDLQAGKSASEALAGALQKVADKLLDIALNSMFSGKGGFFGGGGLLGGAIIPGILHGGGVAGRDGYAHGRAVSPSTFAGAKRYHRGGIAGLQPGEVPAILQRGEVVLPKGARTGGATETIRVVLQDDSGRMAQIADQQIQTRSGAIVQVSVQQSVKSVRGQMPGMIAEAQTRKL